LVLACSPPYHPAILNITCTFIHMGLKSRVSLTIEHIWM
jgi:hypothetical protein